MGKVKITMLRSAAGPDGVYRKGGTYEVSQEIASSFERVGICRVTAVRPTRAAAATKTEEKPAPKRKRRTTRKKRN